MATPTHCHLLSLSDDVLLEICDFVKAGSVVEGILPKDDLDSMKALSQCDRRLRSMLVPQIFRSVAIHRLGHETKAAEVFHDLENSSIIQLHTERFSLDIGTLRRDDGPYAQAPREELLQDISLKLVSIMSRARKLKKASLMMTDDYVNPLEEAFKTADTVLPQILSLKLAPYCHWLIGRCPNVVSVSTIDWRWLHASRSRDHRAEHGSALISSAGRAEKLQHFEMAAWWKVKMLEAVFESMPHITSLALVGGNNFDKLSDMLPVLSRFSRLKVLTTEPTSRLGVGFNPPGCGNAYMGPGGKKLRERVGRDGQKAKQRVGMMVFEACRSLEVAWIGDKTKATATRDLRGGVISVEIDDKQHRGSPVVVEGRAVEWF